MTDHLLKPNRAEQEGGRFLSRRASFGLMGGGALATIAALAGCGSDSAGPNGGGATINGLTRAAVQSAFGDIQKDEDNHVIYLTTAIPAKGGTARPAPTFDTTQPVWNPTTASQLYELAVALENTGTGAYVYATRYLASDPDVLVAGASIGLVEGRHAGFLNILTSRPILTDPTPGQNDRTDPTGKTFLTLPFGIADKAQEVPQAPSTVVQRAQPFLVNVQLNGGPPPPPDDFSGQGNPLVAVLNYALLLEYLEKTWYDRNVPKYLAGQLGTA
ncbi:MAG TPA: ferritin-like domain-containing protein [Chthonomonadales bacterium]|nr:ferritin-like domain-containing protein [Chthonomonadales bacterium]